MHKEIFTENQVKLFSIVKLFSKDFGMVGGTAIALYLGHRESIDFDLFSYEEFSNYSIKKRIPKDLVIENTFVDKNGEYTFLINGVKFAFFCFPYKLDFLNSFDDIIKLPDLLTLASMKAFALGRRAKWKDYVDLYFILKEKYSITEIATKGLEVFGNEFNEKIFRSQLSYFKDIDYSEKVVYKDGYAVDDEVIKKALIGFSLGE